MNYKFLRLEQQFIIGQKITLIKSHGNAHENIKLLWHNANRNLWNIKNRLYREKRVKMGVAFNRQGSVQYDYLAGVPVKDIVSIPMELVVRKISGGKFVSFEYHGPAILFRQAIRDIYRLWLPKYKLKLVPPEECGFNHIERYDDRFNWEQRVSTIELLLPVQS